MKHCLYNVSYRVIYNILLFNYNNKNISIKRTKINKKSWHITSTLKKFLFRLFFHLIWFSVTRCKCSLNVPYNTYGIVPKVSDIFQKNHRSVLSWLPLPRIYMIPSSCYFFQIDFKSPSSPVSLTNSLDEIIWKKGSRITWAHLTC